MINASTISGFRILMLIMDSKDIKLANGILSHMDVPFQWLCHAEGTATSDILDYFGLADTDKVISFCLVPKQKASEFLRTLRIELNLDKSGNGIAFTFPVTGVSMFLMKLFGSIELELSAIASHTESEVKEMSTTATHSLVMVMIDRGFSDDVMKAARGAGAGGGTVIHARELGSDEVVNKWGITIHEEREIVMIITEEEKKIGIVRAIGEACGMQTEARGFVFCIPIDAVAGMNRGGLIKQ